MMTSKNISIHNFFQVLATFLLLCIIFKLLYIFLITMRDAPTFGIGYPFDSYLFDPFHRFTDWLIPLAYSSINNPWDVNSDLAQSLPPVPYGPLTFFYLKITSVFGKLIPFFALVALFLYFNFYFLLKTNKRPITENVLIFTSITVGFYPLHFLIDRGNTVIIGALLISLVYYLVDFKINSNFTDKLKIYILELLVMLLILSKPSFGLFILPMLIISVSSFLRVSFATFVFYMIPVIFFGVSINDYHQTLFKSLSIFTGVINHVHDISANYTLFMNYIFDLKVNIRNVYPVFVKCSFVFLFINTFYILFVSKLRKKDKFLLYFSQIALITLIFNRPSPNYNLVYFLPSFFYLVKFTESENLLKSYFDRMFLMINFIFISFWGFVYGTSTHNDYSAIFRNIGLLGIYFYSILILFNKTSIFEFKRKAA